MKGVKYYIAIDRKDTIWGTGFSPEEALSDAKKQTKSKLLTLECTYEVYKDVHNNGYCHYDFDFAEEGTPYWSYNFKKQIAYFPHPKKRKNVFQELTK